jgi:hypothetical protein
MLKPEGTVRRGLRRGWNRCYSAHPTGHKRLREAGEDLQSLVGRLTEGADHLRILIANQRKDRLALVASIMIALGHEVIAR